MENRQKPFVSAIIVAAGQSTRMGANKILLEIGSMTVIERTLWAFEESALVDEVIIVTSQENMVSCRNIVKDNLISKVTAIVIGGASRGESVGKGLDACNKAADIIAVHDGARPLIKPESIDHAVEAAMEYGVAAIGSRIKDTVKKIDGDDFSIDTIDRETTVLIQTPQVFKSEIIHMAYEKAAQENFEATDDCALTERMGIKTKMVFVPYTNVKLTEPFDVTIATAALRERGKL